MCISGSFLKVESCFPPLLVCPTRSALHAVGFPHSGGYLFNKELEDTNLHCPHLIPLGGLLVSSSLWLPEITRFRWGGWRTGGMGGLMAANHLPTPDKNPTPQLQVCLIFCCSFGRSMALQRANSLLPSKELGPGLQRGFCDCNIWEPTYGDTSYSPKA